MVEHTGGSKSPYYDLQPKTVTSDKPATSGGLRYEMVSANGEHFRLAVADCPAASCQTGDLIARYGLSPEDQRQLEAFEAAKLKEGKKDLAKGGILTAAVVAAPVTLTGAAVVGAVTGGAMNASDQYIDHGRVDLSQVGKEAAIGGALGGGGYLVGKVTYVGLQSWANAADDIFVATLRAEGSPYVRPIWPSDVFGNTRSVDEAGSGFHLSQPGPKAIIATDSIDLAAFDRLNVLDPAVNRLRPGEAGAAAELEKYLGGTFERVQGSSIDFNITSGANKGKSVDFMLTPDTFAQAQRINQYFEKNLPRFMTTLTDDAGAADLVPMDMRFLSKQNQALLEQAIHQLPPELRSKIVLLKSGN